MAAEASLAGQDALNEQAERGFDAVSARAVKLAAQVATVDATNEKLEAARVEMEVELREAGVH